MKLNIMKISALLIAIACLLVFTKGTAMSENKNPKVLLKTSMGDIVIELYSDKAPITVRIFSDM